MEKTSKESVLIHCFVVMKLKFGTGTGGGVCCKYCWLLCVFFFFKNILILQSMDSCRDFNLMLDIL